MGVAARGRAPAFIAPGRNSRLSHGAGTGRGSIEGKLVNKTDAAIVCAGVDLAVVGLGCGMSVVKSSKSDASGRIRVDGLATDEPLMVRADYKSVNYHARVTFNSEGKGDVTVELYEPTASRKDVALEGVRIAFQLSGGRLRSLESYSFNNRTRPPRTYVDPEASFRFSKAMGGTKSGLPVGE